MKKTKDCKVENCVPTPTSCSKWSGGDIEFLGIKDGEYLNNLIWEIVSKLEDITREDLSTFDLDDVLSICQSRAPSEVGLIQILTVLRDSQICLKTYVGDLEKKLFEITKDSEIQVDLKCFDSADNFGNSLSISRDQLDQLVINALCNQKKALDDLNGAIVNLKEELNETTKNITIEEPNIATCVSADSKPTSEQVQDVAEAFCDYKTSVVGDETAVSGALSKFPTVDTTYKNKFGGDWIQNPANLADNYNNALLVIKDLLARVTVIETNCCAITCDDIKIGFTARLNEDKSGLLVRFTSAAGTSIPTGFEDKGSTITITDSLGNKEGGNIVVANNEEAEILVTGMNLSGGITINISAKLGNETLTCEKCISKNLTLSDVCEYCEIQNVGSGNVTVTYSPVSSTTTTTTIASSTTTTTTIAPTTTTTTTIAA